VAGRRSARLYQHVDDPTWLLYLGHWESRAAFEAYQAMAPQPATLRQYRQPPGCRLYRRLALFERMLVPVGVTYADIVSGAPGSHAVRRDLALAYHRASLHSPTDLVLLAIYEAVDEPSCLAIVSGRQTSGSLASSDAAPDRALSEQLRATGAIVEQFVGRALAETAGS
jgi:hypothetical protein